MMYYVSNELSHYGVRGMKWGVRKQRPMVIGRSRSKSYESADQQKAARRARAKRAAKIGAGIAVGVLAAYGAKKLYNKQVLQMANNYARFYNGKDMTFSTLGEAKSNWYGSTRNMLKSIKGYSDRSLARDAAYREKVRKAEELTARQNDYIRRNMQYAAKKNRL